MADRPRFIPKNVAEFSRNAVLAVGLVTAACGPIRPIEKPGNLRVEPAVPTAGKPEITSAAEKYRITENAARRLEERAKADPENFEGLQAAPAYLQRLRDTRQLVFSEPITVGPVMDIIVEATADTSRRLNLSAILSINPLYFTLPPVDQELALAMRLEQQQILSGIIAPFNQLTDTETNRALIGKALVVGNPAVVAAVSSVFFKNALRLDAIKKSDPSIKTSEKIYLEVPLPEMKGRTLVDVARQVRQDPDPSLRNSLHPEWKKAYEAIGNYIQREK